MTEELLKLLAKDDQDLQVIATVLQDAIAPVSEMRYLQSEKNFVLVVHRFRWDCATVCAAPPCYERISTAVDIQGVEAAQYIGFDPEAASLMLDLLTITLQDAHLHLVFAGGARLRLKVGAWHLKIHDFGEAWPTTHRPSHAT